jgi:two-component system NarL family response regulator
MDPIKVLLVNEVPLLGSIFSSVLTEEKDIDVAACVTSVESALAVLQQQQVDVAVVSIGLPDGGARDLIRAIVDRTPRTKVLALGLAEDNRQDVLHYIEAGAAGYILKDSSLQEFLDVIRLAQRGEARVSTGMAGAMIERLSSLARMFVAAETRLSGDIRLTSRELEVLQCIGQGLTNQEIAAHLVVEVGTVKNHVHNILEKLSVSNRNEAASYLAFVKR